MEDGKKEVIMPKIARKRKSRKRGRIDTAEKQRGANNPRKLTKEEAKNHPGAPG